MTFSQPLRIVAFVGALVAAACGSTSSPAPVSTEASPAGIVIGCASIEEVECHAAAARLLAEIPVRPDGPFDIQITVWGCPNELPCPAGLEARGAIAYVEYAGGPDSLTYTIGGVPWIVGPLDNGFTEPIAPRSRRVFGAGPFPFELGHCGLSHLVDFDGSYWVATGVLDGAASGFINGESGQMRLLAANLAVYMGRDGFTAQLARFPGAKRFWLCA